MKLLWGCSLFCSYTDDFWKSYPKSTSQSWLSASKTEPTSPKECSFLLFFLFLSFFFFFFECSFFYHNDKILNIFVFHRAKYITKSEPAPPENVREVFEHPQLATTLENKDIEAIIEEEFNDFNIMQLSEDITSADANSVSSSALLEEEIWPTGTSNFLLLSRTFLHLLLIFFPAELVFVIPLRWVCHVNLFAVCIYQCVS